MFTKVSKVCAFTILDTSSAPAMRVSNVIMMNTSFLNF
jgi:hypothetical protein